MKDFHASEAGFTLVEVILSIALLSIASVVVLELFMTSQNLNTTSRQTDIASVVCTNTLELLRHHDGLAEAETSLDLESAPDGYHRTTPLDEAFSPVPTDASGDTSPYVMDLALTATDTPGLFDVVVYLTRTKDDAVLVRYTTKHYFKEEVSVHGR